MEGDGEGGGEVERGRFRGEGVSRFYVKKFLSHSAEKFRRRTLLCCVSENFRYRKRLWIRGGGEYQDFPSKIFCLTGPKNFEGGHFAVSEKFEYQKHLCIRMGYHYFLLKNFLSHSTEKIRRWALLCFKKFWYRNFSCIEEGIKVLSTFCLTVTKSFVKNPSMLQKNLGIGKFYAWEWDITFFLSNYFCSQYRKSSLGNISLYQKNFYAQERDITIFPWKFSCLTVSKNFVGEHFCVSEKLWYRDFLWIGEGHHGFVQNFLSHSDKMFRGEPLNVAEKFGYLEILCMRMGYHCFLFKLFLLTVPKKFVGENFAVSEKLLCLRTGYYYFPLKIFLSHSTEKFRRWAFLCFRKIVVSRFLMNRRGASRFCQNFFVSQWRNVSWATPQCFRNFWESEKFMHENGISIFSFEIRFVSQYRKSS